MLLITYGRHGIGLMPFYLGQIGIKCSALNNRISKKAVRETMEMSENLGRERKSELVSFFLLSVCCEICLSIQYICIQQTAMN